MNKKTKKYFRRFCKVFAAMLLSVLFLYGAALFFMAFSFEKSVRHAKAEYPSVPVRITEMQRAFNAPLWFTVTLCPTSDTQDVIRENTYAQTVNYRLEVGDVLTMYYDPEKTDERIVDFGGTSFVYRIGGCFMGSSFLCGTILLIRRIRKRRHRKPPVHMAEQHTP